ncbi:DUF7282 domain-containing protein [Natrarchaeobaculum aegyptiacum]|uniref:DUF7282 domain-containing protein n=1 Tax=Natrarchaeobaculum aegyptiacum TaxID=745377 RepID=A0A2Z2I043_9EURY|nr:hypothetical protein [Natrarchaeobaculum aegyptiacum]ARS91717.1 hypothetical protein B1756_06725 [Natrarchaeobaculum aegyptiacum]
MSTRSTLATIKRIVAIVLAIAIVLAAGVIVGQAPAIFGVEEAPEATITFEDQQGDGERVVVEEVTLSDGGFVVIADDDETLTVSEYLEAGTHEHVAVERDEDGPELLGSLTATVHQDTTDDETYAYEETDGEEDHPYLEDGFPVSDSAAVAPETDDEEGPFTDSFAVDSLSVPATATTDDSISVVAEISNPTDLDLQGPVEIRVDGRLIEQQTLDLEPGESQEVTAEVDASSLEPGERTLGVYTEGDGLLETVDLEFHTDPDVSVVDADAGRVTVDAAIPATGFVAIEDAETNATLGVSDELEAGEHENVSIGLADADPADDDELRAVLYEGDPDDPDEAMPIEHDDDVVETTFTIEAFADDDPDDDDTDDPDLDDVQDADDAVDPDE